MKISKKHAWYFFFLFAFVFAPITTYLIGCEKGATTNSTGPTNPSRYTLNLTASNTVVSQAGQVTLTATVYDSNGALADDVLVTFSTGSGSLAPNFGTTGLTSGLPGRVVVVLSNVTSSTTVTATVEDLSVQVRIYMNLPPNV